MRAQAHLLEEVGALLDVVALLILQEALVEGR